MSSDKRNHGSGRFEGGKTVILQAESDREEIDRIAHAIVSVHRASHLSRHVGGRGTDLDALTLSIAIDKTFDFRGPGR